MRLALDRRRELGAFLRARREATSPAEAGLLPAARDRRRTPGLRREELAQLCGISTTWYSWTEQGRDIALSAEALARLADALRMTAAERAYLFELTRRRDPAPAAAPAAPAAPAELLALLRVTAAPAYLLDRLWHARGWNEAAADLFAPWLASGQTSLLCFVFLNPAAREFICDWEERARRLLAEFRADIAHHPEDAAVAAMLRDLCGESREFAKVWNSHAVLGRDGGWRAFNHPARGRLRYEQTTLTPAAYPFHKLVVLLPG